MPEWLGPGAVVAERGTPDRRTFVVISVSLQASSVPTEGSTLETIFQEHTTRLGGAYVVTLAFLNTHSLPMHLDVNQRIVGNLETILAAYEFVGAYYTMNGELIPSEPRPNLQRALARLQGLEGNDDEPVFPDWQGPIDAEEGDLLFSEEEGDVFEGFVRQAAAPTNGVLVIGMDPAFRAQDGTGTVRAEPERDRPIVTPNQVWLLPPPNEGLWRTSAPQVGYRHGSLRLTNVREPDRMLDCTPTWLVEHGIRQDPPDPRSRGGEIVLGQIWEIPSEALHRYKDVRRWRVTAVDAARVTLRSADNGSKRLWWDRARLLRLGTCVGDGHPRRTAYQRLLEDDTSE